MTSLEVYGLVSPFVLLALGWLAVWWNHVDIKRLRGERTAARPRPAE